MTPRANPRFPAAETATGLAARAREMTVEKRMLYQYKCNDRDGVGKEANERAKKERRREPKERLYKNGRRMDVELLFDFISKMDRFSILEKE